MRFCPNCGAELSEGTHFCSNCGHSLQLSVKRNTPSHSRRMHCPECKSTDISPIVETEVTGGAALNHSFSKRNSVSAMQFNNTHRNYWMCSNCGCKFRNIQNLEEEIKTTKGLVTRGIIGGILFAVLMILFTAAVGFGLFSVLCIFLVLMAVAAVLILKNRVAKLSEERAYLKKQCFN